MVSLSIRTLKGYDICERIGQGAFGDVFRAYQPVLDREVAVKVILPRYANQPDFIRRFETEAQLVARVEHLHIVPLYDYWRDPDGAYLVMRYLRGGSLKDWIGQDALDPGEALRLIEQIAPALVVAHRQGVVHRDIKPSNILLDEERNAYLADFGIARVLGGEPSVEGLRGTLDYVSPEQIRSLPVTPQTDIYALGLVLYEMLTGSQPFSPTSSPAELLHRHLEVAVPDVRVRRAELPDALNHVIQTATAKTPGDRYPDASRLAQAVREALAAAKLTPAVTESGLIESLTDREREVLRLMAEGLSNNEIASQLVIALSTVKWHVQQVYGKLGASNRRQSIAVGQRLGLLTGGEVMRRDVLLPDRLVGKNPYKGLAAFQQADAADFFGREGLVGRLVARLQEDNVFARCLVVVGPSGSGKSSVVRGGLLPALERGAVLGSEKWFVVDMLPGGRPLDRLEVALGRVAAQHLPGIMEQLRRDAHGLVRVADLVVPQDSLLLVIDQFEELFTLVEDPAVIRHVLDLLYTAVHDPRSRVRVVITLRADFFDRPLMYPDFFELIQHRTEVVGPLTPAELEQAIVKPAEMAGVTVDPGLVAALVAEVHEQPGTLPLLEYALTELFDRRVGRTMTLAAYQAIGGALGALTRQADDVYEGLPDAAQESARQSFLRLVTLGEGTEDMRRRALRSELSAIAASHDDMEEVLNLFGEARLLTFDRDPASREPTVEVAHEALIQRWERLREWIDASRADIRQQRLLAAAAAEWDQAGRERSYLLGGSRLAQFEDWAARTDLALTPGEHAFMDASIVEQRAQQARQRRVRSGVLVAVTLVAAVLAILALWANSERDRAEGEKDRAETAEQEALRQASIGLAAQAVAELESDTPERGVLLVLEALEHFPYTPQAERALAQIVYATRPYINLTSSEIDPATIRAASFSSNGARVATTADEYDGVIWDAEMGQALMLVGDEYLYDRPLRVDVAWSPDDLRLATVVNSTEAIGRIEIWDAATGDKIATWGSHNDQQIWAADWSADDLIITGGADNTVRIWQADTGEEVQTLAGHSGEVHDITLSPDGVFVASASADTTVRIWDVLTGEALQVLLGHLGAVNSVDWSPDGSRLISGGDDGLAIIWETASGKIIRAIGHTDAVLAVEWSPDGMLVATASADGTSRVWDVLSGALVSTIPGKSLAWSPDGNRLIAGLGVASLRMWDMSWRPVRLVGHNGDLTDAKWSPDGTRLVTTSFDNTVRVWDAVSGENLVVRSNNPGDGGEIDFIPGSDWAVTGGFGTTYLWNIKSGEERFVFPSRDDGVIGHAVSPDGSRLVLFGDENSQMVDLATGEILFEFSKDFEGGCFFLRLSWSPDGRYFVTPCSNLPRADTWDAETGEHVKTLLHADGVNPAAWSPDGTRILTADLTGVVHVWNAESGDLLFDFRGHTSAVYDAAWSQNGNYIASGDDTGTVRIWDAKSGQEVNVYHVGFGILGVSWSPDSTQIITSGFYVIPDIRRVWQSTDELIAYAKACCVFRDLTPEERQQFGLPPRSDLPSKN